MTVERQVHWLVRAWPYPDRMERGDEIVGTTLDLVPEGRTRVPLLTAFNLVIGGLTARRRARPPLWRWLLYVMGLRLPLRWHRWMLNNLLGPGWRFRLVRNRILIMGGWVLLVQLAVSGILGALVRWPGRLGAPDPFLTLWYWCGVGAGVLVGAGILCLGARWLRDRILARNGYLTPPYYNVPPANASSPTRASQP